MAGAKPRASARTKDWTHDKRPKSAPQTDRARQADAPRNRDQESGGKGAREKAADPGERRFLASFRIGEATSLAKGDYSKRRGALIALIKARSGAHHHDSTSTWTLMAPSEMATDVRDLLAPALDLKLDYLQVERIGPFARAGNAQLKT